MPSLSLGSDPARPGVVALSVRGLPGGTYILQTSCDLATWTDGPEVILDEAGSAGIELAKPSGADCGFYRLRER
jgi:hypothetical protein